MSSKRNDFGIGGASPPVPTEPSSSNPTIRVWDSSVRIFHWSLVVAFIVAWATGDEAQELHELAGYTIVGLVTMRIVWGFLGTTHARFADFLYRPSTVIQDLTDTVRGRGRRTLGHGPAGGAMIVALLVMLAIVCVSGFAMTTDTFWHIAWAEDAHEISVKVTLMLIGLHLVGVFAASIAHRENLVKTMITGRKRR